MGRRIGRAGRKLVEEEEVGNDGMERRKIETKTGRAKTKRKKRQRNRKGRREEKKREKRQEVEEWNKLE